MKQYLQIKYTFLLFLDFFKAFKNLKVSSKYTLKQGFVFRTVFTTFSNATSSEDSGHIHFCCATTNVVWPTIYKFN